MSLHRLLYALFRGVLRLFPASYRVEFGSDALGDFRRGLQNRVKQGGRAAALLWGIRALFDAVRIGTLLRMRLQPYPPWSPTPTPVHKRGSGSPSPFRELRWDVRYAFRTLRRSPGFTLAATVILAIGIGANVTTFTALRAVIVPPPRWEDPEGLVFPFLADAAWTASGEDAVPFWSYAKAQYFRTSIGGLADASAYAQRTLSLWRPGSPERVSAEFVDPEYFRVLKVAPAIGRTLHSGPLATEDHLSVVLGYGLWRRHFGETTDVRGASVQIGEHTLTVVGVMPPGFSGLTGDAEVWLPVTAAGSMMSPLLLQHPDAAWLRVVARLHNSQLFDEFRARTAVIGDEITEIWPATNGSEAVVGRASTYREARRNEVAERSVLFLSVAALLVLTMAVANLGSLIVARTSARQSEHALRISLGAGRGRIFRAVLVESLILGAFGAVGSLAVAYAGTAYLNHAWPTQFSFSSAGHELPALDVTSLELTFEAVLLSPIAAVLTGMICAAVSLAGLRRTLRTTLQRGANMSRPSRTRHIFTSLQTAAAFVLLTGTLFTLRSMAHLQGVQPGFQQRGLLVVTFSRGPDSPAVQDPAMFEHDLIDRVSDLPAVQAASFGDVPPFGGRRMMTGAHVGYDPGDTPSATQVGVHRVDEDYFDVLGIPLRLGRAFDQTDAERAERLTILSRVAANSLGGSEPLLGSNIRLERVAGGQPLRVVGIVDDVLYGSRSEAVGADVYLYRAQFPTEQGALFIRAEASADAIGTRVRDVLEAMIPGPVMVVVRDVEELGANSMSETRMIFLLLLGFAVVALTLVVSGLWGVVANTVTHRTREIGIRVALGASRSQVDRVVVGRAVMAATVGIAVGSMLALIFMPALESLLFGLEARDPATFLAAAAMLVAVSAGAAWIPARRATHLDPVAVLRRE